MLRMKNYVLCITVGSYCFPFPAFLPLIMDCGPFFWTSLITRIVLSKFLHIVLKLVGTLPSGSDGFPTSDPIAHFQT